MFPHLMYIVFMQTEFIHENTTISGRCWTVWHPRHRFQLGRTGGWMSGLCHGRSLAEGDRTRSGRSVQCSTSLARWLTFFYCRWDVRYIFRFWSAHQSVTPYRPSVNYFLNTVGPAFHTAPTSDRLSPESAQFVDVIHTSGLWVGIHELVRLWWFIVTEQYQ